MAIQFSGLSEQLSDYEMHHLQSFPTFQLPTQHLPPTRTKPALWKYAIWSYEDPDLTSPQKVLPRDDILPRYIAYDGSIEYSDTQKMNSELGLGVLPEKRYHRLYRNLRWTWFTVYHRLHLLVILPNITVMIYLGVKHGLLKLPSATMATAVAANIAVGVLIRQDLFINLLFGIIGLIPQSWPLRIRRLAAKIHHLGGVHSGAGVAATVWFGLQNVALIQECKSSKDMHQQTSILAVTIVLDVLFVGILALAYPTLRKMWHNTFEMVHRFAGWSAVILFWVQFLLVADSERKILSPSPRLIIVITKSPIFYLLVFITMCIVFPWLRLRKVPVHAEPLSGHAVRLHFTHENLSLCSSPRISDNPLFEWHAFAGIPEENGQGFSIIVSRAGDWTRRIIESPPTHIWTRGKPARGVLYVAPIFRSVVLVATGSGIGPVLSLLYARGMTCRILWSTRDPERTYRRNVIEHVLLADPAAVILNTTASNRRPDLALEAYRMYRSSGAEAVFVVSNPEATRKVVYALESRGVPVFAPIFDS